jgi:hypothetical protein
LCGSIVTKVIRKSGTQVYIPFVAGHLFELVDRLMGGKIPNLINLEIIIGLFKFSTNFVYLLGSAQFDMATKI